MLFKYIIILVFLLQFKEMLLWLFFLKNFTPKKGKSNGNGNEPEKEGKKIKKQNKNSYYS